VSVVCKWLQIKGSLSLFTLDYTLMTFVIRAQTLKQHLVIRQKPDNLPRIQTLNHVSGHYVRTKLIHVYILIWCHENVLMLTMLALLHRNGR